jgi:hypothetical protein
LETGADVESSSTLPAIAACGFGWADALRTNDRIPSNPQLIVSLRRLDWTVLRMLDIDGTSNQQFHSDKEYMDQEGLVQTFPKWRQARSEGMLSAKGSFWRCHSFER